MRTRWMLLVALGLALAAGLSAGEAGEHFGVEVTISPVAGKPGIFEGRVVVTSLATEEVVSAPRLLFEAGEEARVQSAGRDGLYTEIGLTVDESGQTATYEAVMKRGDTLISRQRVTVRLSPK